jgi:hypothetical protein
MTQIENIVPKTLKNAEGSSSPRVTVDIANTPIGNVNPHHPILNGNFERLIEAMAKNSHTRPKPQRTMATAKPRTYRTSPAIGWRVLV